MAELNKADTEIVGRVAIRVSPDTKRFRSDLATSLRRIEGSLKVNIGARITSRGLITDARAAIRDLNAALKAGGTKVELPAELADLRGFKVDVRADTSRARRDLRDLREDVRDGADFAVGLRGVMAASARLAALTRARTVSIVPVVKGSALAAARRAIKGLDTLTNTSGFARLGSSLNNLLSPGTMLRIGTLTTGLASLVSVAGAGLAGLLSVTSALATGIKTAAGAAVVLPGLFVGFKALAYGISTALEDAVIQIPDVIDEWKRLRISLSESFWANAADPIRDLVSNRLPELERVWSRLNGVLGASFGQLGDEIQRATADGAIGEFFGYLVDGVKEASAGLGGLVDGLKELILFGASYFPQLGSFAADLARDFGAAMQRMRADGSLQAMVDDGITALKDLGRFVGGAASIVGGVVKAADAATGSTLASQADRLEAIAAVIHSDSFQSSLTGFFRAAINGVKELTKAAGDDVLGLFGTLSETAQQLLPRAGQGIGALIGGIANALSSSAIQGGLMELVDGMATGFEKLRPILAEMAGPLGDVMGTLGRAGSELLPVLAQTLSSLLGPFAQVFDTLVGIMTSLAPIVGEGLGAIAEALAELVSDPAVAEGVLALISGLSEGIQALAPVIPSVAPLIGVLGEHLGALLAQAGPALANLFPRFVASLVDMVPALAGVISGLIDLAPLLIPLVENVPLIVAALVGMKAAGIAAAVGLGAAAGPIGLLVAGLAALLLSSEGFREGFISAFKAVGSFISMWVENTIGALRDFFGMIGGWVSDALGWLGDLGGAIGDFFGGGGGGGGSPGALATGVADQLIAAKQNATGGGGSTVININNPAAEPSSTSLIRAVDRTGARF